jgi:hypothetical protein
MKSRGQCRKNFGDRFLAGRDARRGRIAFHVDLCAGDRREGARENNYRPTRASILAHDRRRIDPDHAYILTPRKAGSNFEFIKPQIMPWAEQYYATVVRLFDHLVGACEQRRRHVDAERLRRLEINQHSYLVGEANARRPPGVSFVSPSWCLSDSARCLRPVCCNLRTFRSA